MKIQRSHVTAIFFGMAVSVSSSAQTAPTFSLQNYPSGQAPLSVYAIDVNNDGIPDVIQTTGDNSNADNLPLGFTVSLSRGNGTFLAPVTYPMTIGTSVPMRFTPGDFNGDGNVDLAFAIPGTTQVAVARGNGNGTFQAVQYIQIAVAAGETFSSGLPIFAADFNHDGKLDLLVAAVSPPIPNDPYFVGPQDLYLLEGDGNGGFSNPRSVYTPPSNTKIDNFAIGDFNSDDITDVVFLENFVCNPLQSNCLWDLDVLFGDGNFGFERHPLLSLDAGTTNSTLGAGDLNGDGRSDIFFINGSTDQLDVYLGQPDKTFTFAASNLPSLVLLQFEALVPGSSFAMADFNDDGRMDLVAYAYNAIPQSNTLLFMLGAGAPGTFTFQVLTLPGYHSDNSEAVVGDFNGDTKPDVLLGQYDWHFGPLDQSTLSTFINSTSGRVWSDCGYPMKGQGISLCAPIQYAAGPVSFNASASSYGLLRKMELWVDGKKVSEQYHTWENRAWINFTSTFSPGTHNAALFAADIDHSLKELSFPFTVGADGCAAPSSPGVNICRPWGSSFVTSPTTVQAAARVTGTLARMEIWVDGVKKFTETSSTSLDAAVGLKPGVHRFDIYAVNTAGTKWMQTVSATVQ